jgi:hypothetical protein
MGVNFVFVYENKRMKLVEIVLERWSGVKREKMEGINLTKIYCKNLCKYQNVSLYTNMIC